MSDPRFKPIEDSRFKPIEDSRFKPIEETPTLPNENVSPSERLMVPKNFGTDLQQVKEFFYNPEETAGQNVARTAMQIPKVAAYYAGGKVNLVLEAIKGLAGLTAGADIPEEIRELQAQYPEQAEEIERHFREGAQEAVQYAPAISSIMGGLEKAGVPTEAKTGSQKATELFGIGAMGAKNVPQAISRGINVDVIYGLLRHKDVPEQVAEPLSLLLTHLLKPSKAKPTIQKPSSATEEPTIDVEPTTTPKEPLTAPLPEETPNVSVQKIEPEKAWEKKAKQVFKPKPSYEVGEEAKRKIFALEKPEYELALPEKGEPDVEYEERLLSIEPTKHEPERVKYMVGRQVSPLEAKNTTEGGKIAVQSIEKAETPVREEDKRLFNLARDEMSMVTMDTPSLRTFVSSEVNKLKEGDVSLLSPQKKLYLNKLEGLGKTIGHFDEYGDIIDPKEVNGNYLVELIKDLNLAIDHDFKNGSAKSIFKPLTAEITKAIEKGLQQAGNRTAMNVWLQAKNFHKNEWVNRFENERLLPFRNRSKNQNYATLFDATKNLDTMRAVHNALTAPGNEGGNEISDMIKRYVVTQFLKPAIENPGKIGSLEFNERMRNLEAILSPEQIKNVRKMFGHYQRKHERNLALKLRKKVTGERKREKEKEHNEPYNELKKTKEAERKQDLEKWAKKYGEATELKGMTAEKLFDHANTMSGLLKIKRELSKTDQGKRFYENVFRPAKAADIAYNGKISEDPETFLRTIQNKDKQRLLIELVGSRDLVRLRQYAYKIVKNSLLMKKRELIGKKIEETKHWKDYFKNPKNVLKIFVDLGSGKVPSAAKDIFFGEVSNRANIDKLLKEEDEITKALLKNQVSSA